ncbi:MAG: bacteriohemerythrin [Nitrospirae bacterium YQR-1]
MPFIDFVDKLKVNVTEIDNQHKKLIDIINELHNAMATGKGITVLGKTLNELIEYTKSHFSMEENLIQKYKYSDNNKHKTEHDKLTKQVVDLKSDFEAGKMVVTVEVMNFLKKWLNDHILDKDKHLAVFLNEKGVK